MIEELEQARRWVDWSQRALARKGQSTPFSLMIVGLGTTPEQRAIYAALAGVLDGTHRQGFARDINAATSGFSNILPTRWNML